MSEIDLSISIVNTNNWEYLHGCLNSIFHNLGKISFEVLVADNYSEDGSVENVEKLFPEVRLTKNTQRFGFAKNNNINIKASKGKYVLILNDDTVILPNTIEGVLPIFESNPDIGVIGCKMIGPAGQFQGSSARKFRTLFSEFIIETGLFRIFPQIYITPHAGLTEIDLPSEAGFFVRREVIDQVGIFDERFFMFGEGADWCQRIKKAKWRIVYYPDCQIIHYGGTTNRKSSIKMFIQFYKSTYLLFQKNHCIKGLTYRIMICMIFSLKRLYLSLLSLLSPSNRKHYYELKPYYDGLLDFFIIKFKNKDYPFAG